jgi:orotate phosphoribosyltransferase
MQVFKDAGALLEGHFEYASGKHGNRFLQAARVLQYPDKVEILCKAIADKFRDDDIQLVVGPATGGILLAYETARQMGCRGVFAEKEADGTMAVKRGFKIDPGTRVLVVEDIITTGGSVMKAVDHVESRGAQVVGISVLIDRSGGKASFNCKYEPLTPLSLESFEPSECPLCAQNVELVEPDDLIV